MLGVERTEIGVACGKCDWFSLRGREQCPECSADLAVQAAGQAIQAISSATNPPKPGSQSIPFGARSDGASTAATTGTVEQLKEQVMDQARYYVCESCMTPVPSGHKFCGRCGAPVPETMLHQPVDFYSDMQDPARARLILIRGEGMDGLSYHLKADEHVVGRQGQVEFPDDPFVSPRHANFFYRDNRLVVRDEGSLNGVYFRIRGTVEIVPGDMFLVGEQVFRLDPTPKASDGADGDGTFFYSSPKYPSAFRLNQIFEGGAMGMTVCTRGNTIQIGREDGDINFPADVFMSARHANVEEREGKYLLTDMDSRNGTYIRLKAERPLSHGDYVFIGRRLLRVEMNSN